MQRYIIDRFEEEFAICEDNGNREMVKIKKDNLPPNIREGDIIKFENNQYIIDKDEMKKVEERIKEKMNKLFKN